MIMIAAVFGERWDEALQRRYRNVRFRRVITPRRSAVSCVSQSVKARSENVTTAAINLHFLYISTRTVDDDPVRLLCIHAYFKHARIKYCPVLCAAIVDMYIYTIHVYDQVWSDCTGRILNYRLSSHLRLACPSGSACVDLNVNTPK